MQARTETTMKLMLAAAAVAALALVPLLAQGETATGPAEMTPVDVYAKKCAMCHGKDGVAKAMAKGSANLNDPAWQKATSVDAVIKITTEGKDKMPAYTGKLTPEQIKAVSEYVLKLQTSE